MAHRCRPGRSGGCGAPAAGHHAVPRPAPGWGGRAGPPRDGDV